MCFLNYTVDFYVFHVCTYWTCHLLILQKLTRTGNDGCKNLVSQKETSMHATCVSKKTEEFNITATRQNNKTNMALQLSNFKTSKICVLINVYKMFNNTYKFELILSFWHGTSVLWHLLVMLWAAGWSMANKCYKKEGANIYIRANIYKHKPLRSSTKLSM